MTSHLISGPQLTQANNNGGRHEADKKQAAADPPRDRAASDDDDDDETEELTVVIETKNETANAPDGGWGWWIVVGCIVLRVIIGGVVRSSGLFFLKFQERFGGSAADTAWVTSLAATIRLLTGPVVSVLCNRFSERQLTLCGAGIYVIALIISGFAPSLPFLYFSFGVVGGIGRSLALTPCVIILGKYFNKRRSKAFGISSAGFGIGGFAITPLIELLFLEYGFTGTYIVLAGLTCNLFVGGLLFRPLSRTASKDKKARQEQGKNGRDGPSTMPLLPTHDARKPLGNHDDTAVQSNSPVNGHSTNGRCPSTAEVPTTRATRRRSTLQEAVVSVKAAFTEDKESGKSPLIAFSILKDVRFLTLCLATLLFSLPTTGLFLPPLVQSRGLSKMQAAYLLSISAGSDTVSRIVSGFVLDMKTFRKLRPWIFNGATFLQSIAVFVFPSVRTFESFAALCCFNGCVMGVKMAQGSVILVDILGVDKLASSVAIVMLMQAFGTFIGPPVSGFLRDVSGEYDGAFYFAGTAILIGACMLTIGNARKYLTDKRKQSQQLQDRKEDLSTKTENNNI